MIEDIMPTNELGAAEKRYELRKRFFVEFASVASNTADIEYISVSINAIGYFILRIL